MIPVHHMAAHALTVRSESLKGQSHENVGELSVWGVSLGSN
jgi:hypothetical protein